MLRITVSGLESAISYLSRRPPMNRVTQAVRSAIREGKSELKNRVTARYTAANPMGLGKTTTQVNGLSGSLKVGGRRNVLRKFIIKPRRRMRRQPVGGVYANVVKGQGGSIRRAFIGKGGLVFEREGASRLPLRHLNTTSLPGMAERVGEQVAATMRERLGIELANVFG